MAAAAAAEEPLFPLESLPQPLAPVSAMMTNPDMAAVRDMRIFTMAAFSEMTENGAGITPPVSPRHARHAITAFAIPPVTL
ncbi:hypothetical protein GCM10010214_23140 [Streptomyces abikoensis]|nr:hypothetical protein GCM10010214_23140 [Streptomyces abikoensis]